MRQRGVQSVQRPPPVHRGTINRTAIAGIVSIARSSIWHADCLEDVPSGTLSAARQGGNGLMDEDRIEGPVKEGTGKVKEEWGDLTDDPGTEIGGKVEQGAGTVQREWGEAKDEVRREDVDEDLDEPR
jgi:uncharacterized protein YjbJ (UPF0337 family)